ncbi:hypothetical protein JTE90_004388 [Oedothorax gibbosus]|uniref:Endothelin-converting enzyme 1 n=1 Tax=Oedothorax gibbosus TaxID=931172 RepID=A0AAV6UQD2_9ARAC|nr:hypothetical protein JTE90_004388 [Oedothorax gibbosus]
MPFADYVPQFNEGNFSTYYRRVLGVPLKKRHVCAIGLVFLFFVLLIVVLCYAGSSATPVTDNQHVTVLPFVSIDKSVKTSADPCENFYEFACGLWSEDDLVKETAAFQSSENTFSILQNAVTEREKQVFLDAKVNDDLPRTVNDAIKVFQACVALSSRDVIEVDYILKYFNQALGGWPMLNPKKFNEADFDWVKASAYLLRTADIDTIVKIQNIPDEFNSSRKLVYLSPPAFEDLPLHDYTADFMLQVSLSCLNHSDVQLEDVPGTITEISETELKWHDIFDKTDNVGKNRTRMTIKDLKLKLPHFDWLFYMQLVFNDTWNKIGGVFSEDDEIIVDNFEFLDKASEKFQKENFKKTEVANLFGWFVIQKIWKIIPGVVRKYSEVFDETEEEIESSAQYQCLSVVKKLYYDDLEYLYVQNMSHIGISRDGKILVNSIKNSLRSVLDGSDWLDESTKDSAIQKLNSMKATIGFPNFLTNKYEYEKFKSDFPSFSSCIMQTYFEVKSYLKFKGICQIKFDNFTSELPRPVTDASAYYQPLLNSLTLPISMFNAPFYYHKGPWYLNFGALGIIIGHEIMHGFDDVGRQFDDKGNLNDWWSNETLGRYQEHTECFRNQYNDLKRTNISNLTLNEDIADSEGLNLAYLAYKDFIKLNGANRPKPYMINKKRYTPEQMFFIAFGSVWCSDIKSLSEYVPSDHSNRPIRVVGAVSNSEAFSQAFNCPKGSLMNPEVKCHIW